jgi:hypothetical protein
VTIPDVSRSVCKPLNFNPQIETISRPSRAPKIVDSGNPIDEQFA